MPPFLSYLDNHHHHNNTNPINPTPTPHFSILPPLPLPLPAPPPLAAPASLPQDPNPQIPLNLTQLPELAIQRICGLLKDVKDLCMLSQSCKRMNKSVKFDSEVWRTKLGQYFGLQLEVELQEMQSLYRVLFMYLYCGNGVKYALRYAGIFTDGGCQEERLSYWMDHMFFPYTWQYHCSGIFNKPNCNILAFAALAGPATPTHPMDALVLEYRDFLQQRFPAFQQYGDLPLHRWEYMFEHLMHMVGDGAEAWEVLLDGLKSAEIEAVRCRISEIVEELRMGKPCKQYGIVDIKGDGKCMMDKRKMSYVSRSCIQHHTAIVREIFISRDGTVTCPIRTGVVFIGTSLGLSSQQMEDRQIADQFEVLRNSPIFKCFDNVNSLSKVQHLCKQGSLPKPNCVRSVAAGQWVEFEISDSVVLDEWQMRVGAAVWFQFRDHTEAWSWWESQCQLVKNESLNWEQSPFSQSVENTQGRCQMNIELNQVWTGNTCMVKMIDCENLMEEYNDDNPASNIDINTVRLTGSYIQLPYGVKPKL